ncbi:ligand-dependent nuclear receptor-interacting factor 1 isoform X2 [Patagioenas fasciata]|uniref:ligand-dependent nuclear receptor-interacting factor 1 isoform X2 n=1 Tax=Patagioenas fasciata TaxID=372321 RepID=UPI0032E87464
MEPPGCMYQVVQTTGPDGKNLLKLLPISKSSSSFVPIVQSSAMQNNSKANISSPVHLTFKTQLVNTTAPPSVQISVFQSPNPGRIILTRTIDKQEGVRADSDKETPKPATDAPSVSVDGLSLQDVAVTSSSHQSSTTFMVVNTKSPPGSAAVPVLPSGHHLQIPADAEVISVPASSLPPAIQQKILAAAATGGAESTKMPTVIYVSPVNTVKTVLPKHLQTLCPKPAGEVSKNLIMTAAQKGSSSETVSDGAQGERTPMKWVVQESPQISAPCLIPVKSSNNVASKILKTLSDMKNVDANSANILPLCSSGPGGSQTKLVPIKENALVMYKGKVYLLTKRGSDVLSAQADKQVSSSPDASQKEMSKPPDSTPADKIPHETVNLMSPKSKGVVVSPKDPRTGTDSKNSSPTGLRNDLKPAPAAPVAASAAQQSSPANQSGTFPVTESVSSGAAAAVAPGPQESQENREKSRSPHAASAVSPQPEPACALRGDREEIQCEKVDSLESVIQVKHQEKPHWKQYLELRKQFGLSKEERVYLRRIPLRTSCEQPEAGVGPGNGLKRKNDSCNSSSLDVEITNQHQECVEEEKVIVDPEEDLAKRRKIKSSPRSDGERTRKTPPKSASLENSSSSCTLLDSSVSPAVLPQQITSTDSATTALGRDPEQDPYPQDSDVAYSSIPVLVSCEDDTSVLEGSFRNDVFPLTPPDLDETIRDEKIKRLKQLLREREAALEEMRRKMQQS